MPVGNDPATTAKAAALGGVSGHTDTIEMHNLKCKNLHAKQDQINAMSEFVLNIL